MVKSEDFEDCEVCANARIARISTQDANARLIQRVTIRPWIFIGKPVWPNERQKTSRKLSFAQVSPRGSVQRGSLRYRDRGVRRLFQGEFADFDSDLSDAKLPHEMRSQMVRKCFNELWRLPRDKRLPFFRKRRVIDR